MSEKSEAVKTWRRNTKNRIIEAMGSRCACCGYNRFSGALELHHKNPDKKEFSLGSIRASIISWARIVKELKNCALVCSNCHKEIHAGIRDIPKGVPGFNEEYANYRELGVKGKQHPCPVCFKPISPHKKTCSPTCAAVFNRQIDWDSIDLVKLCKDESILKVSEKLGVSDATIRKRLNNIKSKKTIDAQGNNK